MFRVVGAGDLNRDGEADIVWRHKTVGDVWVWLVNGPIRIPQWYLATVPDTGYRIVGSGDYDGDGKADILWHHATRGAVWTWLMNGCEKKVPEKYIGRVPDVGSRS